MLMTFQGLLKIGRPSFFHAELSRVASWDPLRFCLRISMVALDRESSGGLCDSFNARPIDGGVSYLKVVQRHSDEWAGPSRDGSETHNVAERLRSFAPH